MVCISSKKKKRFLFILEIFVKQTQYLSNSNDLEDAALAGTILSSHIKINPQ